MSIFESFADDEHFSIINVVVAFSFCHRLQMIDDWLPEIIEMFPENHATGSITVVETGLDMAKRDRRWRRVRDVGMVDLKIEGSSDRV